MFVVDEFGMRDQARVRTAEHQSPARWKVPVAFARVRLGDGLMLPPGVCEECLDGVVSCFVFFRFATLRPG